MRLIQLIFSFILLTQVPFLQADPIHPWEVQQLRFQAAESYDNPYLTIPVGQDENFLEVHFRGVSGEAEGNDLRLVGCWNGGDEWVVNFAPPLPGKWKYETHSTDRGLNDRNGELEVTAWIEKELSANPTRRGFVRVRAEEPNAGHYFAYADGTPFFWVGDTWWNWTQRGIHMETFRGLVDDRAEKGFTLGQLFVPGNGWGESASLLVEDYTRLDPDHVKKIEKMIAYANSKGLTVWIHPWWSREDMDEKIGEEKIKRWWKYVIHRFGAYNVIWILAGEYNMYNYAGFPLAFWKDIGRMIKKEDPYERLVGAHPTPPTWRGGRDAPQWSTGDVLHGEGWLDYNQSQSGHGRATNELIPQIMQKDYALVPPKPTVVTEPWYEFIEGNPTGKDIRLGAWGAVLSGAAGHTYGGGHVWRAHVPEQPQEPDHWPFEPGFERNTYNYEGAVSIGVLARFFKELEWWTLAPHPELVEDYPQPFCLARPGQEYVIYLRYGGSCKVRLDACAEDSFTSYWLNPTTGEKSEPRQITGAEKVELRPPRLSSSYSESRDWVLYLKRLPSDFD